jgi:putative phosphoesterase
MRVGFISDAHGNVEAFRRGLEVLGGAGAEQVFFLGDSVGYFVGDSVLSELRARRMPAVLGNHDRMLLKDGVPGERDAVYRLAETRARISAENRRELETWPERRIVEFACGRALLVHGSPRDPVGGYVYEDTDFDAREAGVEMIFMGNTHRPFHREQEGTLVVNVGSCALPRDHGGLGAVCILDTGARTVRILRFDITAETAEALARCGGAHDSVMALAARRPADGRLTGEVWA